MGLFSHTQFYTEVYHYCDQFFPVFQLIENLLVSYIKASNKKDTALSSWQFRPPELTNNFCEAVLWDLVSKGSVSYHNIYLVTESSQFCWTFGPRCWIKSLCYLYLGDVSFINIRVQGSPHTNISQLWPIMKLYNNFILLT